MKILPFFLLVLTLITFGIQRGVTAIKRSSFFKIEEIEIDGDSILNTDSLQNRLDKNKGVSIFEVDEESLRETLGSKVSLSIKKVYPRRLIVKVKKKEPVALLNGVFEVDEDGYILGRGKQNHLPVLLLSLSNIRVGEKVESNTLSDELLIMGVLQKSGFRVIKIEMDESGISVLTEGGKILFGFGDLERKLYNLKTISDEVKEKRVIDLRFKNQIVIRDKRG